MENRKDYYTILKVSPLASPSHIKKSYKKLARIFHPDKNPNNPEAAQTFKEINEAYEILSDSFKRKEFDNYLKEKKEKQNKKESNFTPLYNSYHSYSSIATPVTPSSENLSEKNTSVLSQLKQYIKKPATNPKSHCGELAISLEEAALGCKKQVLLQVMKKQKLQKTAFEVIVPPGTENQSTTPLYSNNKEVKGLYMSVIHKKHSLYTLEGKDIKMELPIPFTQAILGGTVQIPTLRGQVSFHLPQGIHCGHILQLKGQGFPLTPHSKKRGNMLIKVLIDIPSQLSEEEKNWIQRLQEKAPLCPKVAEFDIKAKLLLKKREDK